MLFFDPEIKNGTVSVNLKQIRLGVVVQFTRYNDIMGEVQLDNKFGHIVGFDRNVHGELCIIVLDELGVKVSIHPSNVYLV